MTMVMSLDPERHCCDPGYQGFNFNKINLRSPVPGRSPHVR